MANTLGFSISGGGTGVGTLLLWPVMDCVVRCSTWEQSCVNRPPVCSAISTAAVTFSFLIPLQVLVKCSYLSLWTLPFVPRFFPSIPAWHRRVRKRHMVWCVSVGILDWGAPLLNHDTYIYREICVCKYTNKGESKSLKIRSITRDKSPYFIKILQLFALTKC